MDLIQNGLSREQLFLLAMPVIQFRLSPINLNKIHIADVKWGEEERGEIASLLSFLTTDLGPMEEV